MKKSEAPKSLVMGLLAALLTALILPAHAACDAPCCSPLPGTSEQTRLVHGCVQQSQPAIGSTEGACRCGLGDISQARSGESDAFYLPHRFKADPASIAVTGPASPRPEHPYAVRGRPGAALHAHPSMPAYLKNQRLII